MTGSLEKKISDAGSFLSEASTWIPEWLPDSAWIEHAPFAFWLVETHEPEILIELGTHMGYSFFSFCQAIARLKLSTRAYAVDTWKGDEHAGFYGEEVFQEVSKHNAERYSGFSQLIRSTFDDALPYFENGSVDLLHIDGRHFYEDVKHDFNSWLPKLSDRGIVLFHDVNVRERSFGVFRYWAELSQRHPHFQFFHGWGLGVLGIGKKLPRPLKALFETEANSRRANKLRKIYARLGASLNDQLGRRRLASEIGLKEAEASALKAQISTLEVHVVNSRVAGEAAVSELSDLRSRLSASEARAIELDAALTLRAGELSAIKTELAEKEAEAEQRRGELETALRETRQQRDSSERRLADAQAGLTQQNEEAAQQRADLERRLVEAEQSAAQQRFSLEGKLVEAKRSAVQQCADLEGRLADAERSAAQQRAHLERRLCDTEKSAAQHSANLKSRLADGHQQLQSTTAQLAAARSEHQVALHAIRRDLASTTAQLDAAKAQLVQSAAELARQRDDAVRQRAELEAERAALQERAVAAEARRESLQAEHDDVLNSTFWRATAPARRLGAVLPQGVRRQARRGARLLYRVLTPHRIAARIAHRRARRENLEKSATPAWAELFDRNWYLARYPDVAAGADQLDPLRHFIHHGAAERRDPNPFFDTSWYLEANPDVAHAGDNALAHYFEHGAAEGCDPSPLFDTSWYLETNSDVAEAGINPLLHYLKHGAAEGRNPKPVFNSASLAGLEASIEMVQRLDRRTTTLESVLEMERERIDWALGNLEGVTEQIDEYHAHRETDEYKRAFRTSSPLVSICVATMDRAEVLVERCISSIRRQNYQNLQIVVIGDNCIDDTACRLASLRDDRIQFVNLPERGPYPRPGRDRWYVGGSNAMNHALSLCEGLFVTHIDDDDEMVVHRIETLLSAALENRAEFLWHPFWSENRDGTWNRLGKEELQLGQVSTGSIFYHRYFTRIPWDKYAYRLKEPGDWNRIRKIKLLRPRLHFVNEPLLYHHVEQAQPEFAPRDRERFLD